MPKIIDRVPPGVDSVFAWNEALRVAKEQLRAEYERSKPDRIYRLADLIKITGLQKSAIYEAIQKGEFPPPVKLTTRSSGWPASEIAKWIELRKQSR
jgi:prophage regulatory protein